VEDCQLGRVAGCRLAPEEVSQPFPEVVYQLALEAVFQPVLGAAFRLVPEVVYQEDPAVECQWDQHHITVTFHLGLCLYANLENADFINMQI
jgi:hypothetical protein